MSVVVDEEYCNLKALIASSFGPSTMLCCSCASTPDSLVLTPAPPPKVSVRWMRRLFGFELTRRLVCPSLRSSVPLVSVASRLFLLRWRWSHLILHRSCGGVGRCRRVLLRLPVPPRARVACAICESAERRHASWGRRRRPAAAWHSHSWSVSLTTRNGFFYAARHTKC